MARTEGLRMAGSGDAVACCENSERKKAVRFARGPFPKYNDGHPPEKSCEEERRRYRKGLTLQRMMPPPPPPPPPPPSMMMMMPCSSSPDDDLDFNVNWFEQAVMSSTSSLAASTALSLASSSPSVAGAGAFDPCRGCHQAQQLVMPSLTIVPPACVRFPSDLEDGPSDTALMIVDDDERGGGVPDGRGGPEDHDHHDDDDDDDVLAPGTVLETIALHPEPPNLCRDSVTSIEEYPLTPRPPGKILMKPSGSSNGRSDDDDDDDDELLKGLDPRDSAGSGGGYDDADLEALWSGAGGSDGCGADGLEEREVDGWARLGIEPSDIKRLEEGDDDSGCWPVIAGSLGKRSTGGVASFGSGPCAVLPRGAVMMRGGIAGALATCGCCTGNVRRLFWGLFMVCGVVLTITTVGA